MKSEYIAKAKQLIASGNLATGEHITHGGKRPRSGRKALDDLGTIVTTIRLTGEQKAAFDMLGGSNWLRHYLQSFVSGNQHTIDH